MPRWYGASGQSALLPWGGLNPFAHARSRGGRGADARGPPTATEVPTAEDHYQIDPLDDLAQTQKPVVYISAGELFATHGLLMEYLDEIVRRSGCAGPNPGALAHARSRQSQRTPERPPMGGPGVRRQASAAADKDLRSLMGHLGMPPGDSGVDNLTHGHEIALALTNKFVNVDRTARGAPTASLVRAHAGPWAAVASPDVVPAALLAGAGRAAPFGQRPRWSIARCLCRPSGTASTSCACNAAPTCWTFSRGGCAHAPVAAAVVCRGRGLTDGLVDTCTHPRRVRRWTQPGHQRAPQDLRTAARA